MFNMINCFFLMTLVMLLLTTIWLTWIQRKKFSNFREKASPFECGFDPKDKARVPFSLRFFLMIMVFLMFDVEMSMLLELPYQLDYNNFKGRIGFIIFLWILVLGTLEEWRRGVLNWKK